MVSEVKIYYRDSYCTQLHTQTHLVSVGFFQPQHPSADIFRRDSEYIGRGMLRLELVGRRPRGGANRRFIDAVKEVMKLE